VSSTEREQESVNVKVRCYLKTCEHKILVVTF